MRISFNYLNEILVLTAAVLLQSVMTKKKKNRNENEKLHSCKTDKLQSKTRPLEPPQG